jgi:hypothetical protein
MNIHTRSYRSFWYMKFAVGWQRPPLLIVS